MQKTLFLLLLLFSSSLMAREIKVLTWNIYMMAEPLAITAQRKRAPLIAKAAQDSGADIIFLQEAFSPKGNKLMGKVLKDSHPYELFLDRNHLKFLNSGLLVRSRFPLKLIDSEIYKACKGIDCFSSKGVQVIELEMEKNKVLFFHTHLQQGQKDKQQAARKEQKNELISLIKKYQADAEALFVIGSFGEDFHQDLFQRFMTDNRLMSPLLSGELNITRGFSVHCFNVPSHRTELVWVDHVLEKNLHDKGHMKELKALSFMGEWSGKNCELSNHNAVLATLEI